MDFFRNILAISLFFFLVISCSVRKVVVNQTSPIIDNVQKAFLSEEIEKLNQDSLPFAIKFSEGLYYYYPHSSYYSGKLCVLLSAYTFAYLDEGPYSDFDETAEEKISLSNKTYKRAMNYGFKSLDLEIDDFSVDIKDVKKVDNILQEVTKDSIETLFWLNFSWAMYLFNDLSNIENVSQLETIKKIAERIIEIEPNYLHGSSYAILIAFYGGRTKVLGGNIKKAKEYYREAKEYSTNKSLIIDYVYLRFVSTQFANSKEFEVTFEKIKRFDTSLNKDFTFVNKMIKRKAKKLYENKSFFF